LRTAFAPTAERNVPERFRAQLNETLAAAANVGNRTTKISKFTYSTSEDAVTWTIFRWLEDEGAQELIARAAGLPTPKGDPEILYWGAPIGGQPTNLSIQLQNICLGIDGKAYRLTEPDVVIAWPSQVVFVEVKYQAKNEYKPGYPHFARYTDGQAAADTFALPAVEVSDAGWYELTRNWRIGSQLAVERKAAFTLVNLAPERIRGEATRFEATIRKTRTRRFAFVSWAQLIRLARESLTIPSDVLRFLEARELEGRWG
jgi:hypothetical protein